MFTTLSTKSSYFSIFRTILLFFLMPFWGCKVDVAPKQPELVFDFDMDGVADQIDLDDDNDGIPDEIETAADIDGDKVGNDQDRDSDGDGIADLIEATGVDKDGDGMLDPWDEWTDENRNGYHDEYEIEPLVATYKSGGKSIWKSEHKFGQILLDQDLDGLPNFWDEDSDNDGISDMVESSNKLDKSLYEDSNADGFDDRLVGHIYTQGDKEGRTGHPEENREKNLGIYQSIYADGVVGSLNGVPDIDDNNNGIPNFLDKASN